MNDEIEFTPSHLRNLHAEKSKKIDAEIIESVKQQLIHATLKGRRSLTITLRADSNWESAIAHFRELGFSVSAYGSDHRSYYDDEGYETFSFIFNWHKETEY